MMDVLLLCLRYFRGPGGDAMYDPSRVEQVLPCTLEFREEGELPFVWSAWMNWNEYMHAL